MARSPVGSKRDAVGGRGAGRWPFWVAVAVLVVGLVVTAVLTLVSSGLYTRNETRLLDLRARDVGTALTAALPTIQTPLASAAELAEATNGSAAKFRQFIAPSVGPGGGRPFISASLWRASDPGRGPLTVVGAPSVLASSMEEAQPFLRRAATSSGLSVIGLLGGPSPRLGYAFSARGPFIAYGASALPADRYAPVQNSSTFTDIDYALYLGDSTKRSDLLVASVRQLPLNGRLRTVRVPFGNTVFTVTVAARGPLAGSLPQRLPWAIAIVGVLLSIGAAALTARLIERRDENRRLFREQRGIAQTLQNALLPATLPQLPGLQTSARYEAGGEGVEVGGDWYDLIPLGGRRLLLVVGDVSGRGLKAATMMVSLRFAIHAYAVQGDSPAGILAKLSDLVNVNTDHQMATVLFALVDVETRTVSVTSAGHLPPLLIGNGASQFVEGDVGPPVGVDRNASYSSTTVSAPAGATLLAFTDGLVERRGENIDVGLERLRDQASTNHATLEQLITRVVEELRDDAAKDDTAIAGIRWVS